MTPYCIDCLTEQLGDGRGFFSASRRNKERRWGRSFKGKGVGERKNIEKNCDSRHFTRPTPKGFYRLIPVSFENFVPSSHPVRRTQFEGSVKFLGRVLCPPHPVIFPACEEGVFALFYSEELRTDLSDLSLSSSCPAVMKDVLLLRCCLPGLRIPPTFACRCIGW